jgi:molecular chaperone DnaK
MRKDAEAHADEDKARIEEIQTRNEVDGTVYRTEKLVKDNADKISADDKAKLETAINAAKEALKGSDAAAIKSAGEKLNEVAQTVGTELYKAAAAKAQAEKAQAGGAGPTGGGQSEQPKSEEKKDEGVIDAEVVDEKK